MNQPHDTATAEPMFAEDVEATLADVGNVECRVENVEFRVREIENRVRWLEDRVRDHLDDRYGPLPPEPR